MSTEEVIRIGQDYTTINVDQINADKSVPVLQEKAISTNVFIDKCNQALKTINNECFILPKKCRLVKQYLPKEVCQQFLFVIEEDPTVRTVRINLGMEAPFERLRAEGKVEEFGYQNFEFKEFGTPYFFRLSFPYVVHIFLVTLSTDQTPLFGHWLFYRLAPLNSTFDYLLRPNLPNIDGAFKVCAGDYKIKATSIAEMVEEYLHHFWSSMFNKDYITNYLSYDDNEFICNFLHWQHYSLIDPNFVFNVDWDNSDMTINEIVDKQEKNYGLYTESSFTLNTFRDFIMSPNLVFSNVKPKTSFSNWIDSMWIDSFNLSIGDKITLRKKEFYIKDFLKISRQSYVILEDVNGKEYKLKDTYKLREALVKTLTKEKYHNSITIGEETFSVKDTILVEYPPSFHTYSVISSIIKDRSGKFLLYLTNGKKYIVNNIKIQKFNRNLVNTNGVTLISGQKYYLFDNRDTKYFKTCLYVTFKQANLDYGELSFDFSKIDSDGRQRVNRFNIQHIRNYKILTENDLNYTKISFLSLGSAVVKTTDDFLLYDRNIYIKNSSNIYQLTFDELKTFVTENEITFPGLVPFKVGDRVCIAIWNEPNEMIKRRQITKFIIDDPEKKVLVETTDGINIRIDPIIINKKILYSSFKHVETEYMDLKSGMVIKPKRIGISCFPRKSNYRIIGFIRVNFSNIPLVLMSNCCTLWPFQITNDFDITQNINVEDPDLTKIKLQANDLLNIDGKVYCDQILLNDHRYSGLRIFDIEEIYSGNNGRAITTIPKKCRRVGFIFPRIELNTAVNSVVAGLVDGNGNVFILPDSNISGRFNFVFDKRIFSNV
jgi:hypothetical protein